MDVDGTDDDVDDDGTDDDYDDDDDDDDDDVDMASHRLTFSFRADWHLFFLPASSWGLI